MSSLLRPFYAAFFLLLIIATGPAHAQQAHIVIDVASGRVLEESNADAPIGPASLTKMMTLYMTFEALREGVIGWEDRLPVSSEAARRPSYKLGLTPGDTISVREAVTATAIRSANDATVVIAEALAGDEARFARYMTNRAKLLGLRNTIFATSNGLTAAGQVTTARDMARLGIALMRDFPSRFSLFSTKSFTFRGRGIEGHNDLIGGYPGVNGIKTGYTAASGYHVVTSVRAYGRRLIVVVMGERSVKAREVLTRALLDRYLAVRF
ncbi:D-alanyl-D-alanine carboxypeptidase family protein [Limoniibacter endophyticus]|uniref:Peptidase S11 D-alanyl-D-alanine carboxypeptidase A N-terminal domain-containing protein n=1 Tax=Limoniibacter endophyticus TaxID=1565040 RepID=A0A8J3DET2_9HYPH|nr:D-alanyl-D-alanine carboxypeptidase family protein [Limoniibacter endophyticus]GHC64340.1 hypothetical protein GCM10010136_06230 [Limoniibacter endophyticus]